MGKVLRFIRALRGSSDQGLFQKPYLLTKRPTCAAINPKPRLRG